MESKYGIPTVGVHLNVFAPLVRNTVKSSGMPSARQAFVPTPLMNTPPPVLREYVEGNDPVHGRPFMAEVFDQLTRPIPAGELRGEDWDRSTPRYVEADSEDEMHALFRERRYTDFLPIILPTEERVARMLAGTSHAPDEMVGKMRPTIGMEFWHYDVEKVAVNAVMAGAEPKHFPVLLALASSGDTGRQSSMSSMGNMVVVNGPIRHEIGMNCGIGAMGPYNHANAVIGRSFGIMSQNLQGGSVPGVTYNGSQGNNFSYNCITFAENEEASPWEPYHVQYGYDKDESAVTVSYIWGNVWAEYLRDVLAGEAHGDDLRPRAGDGLHDRARPDRRARVRRAWLRLRRTSSRSGSTRTRRSRGGASGTTSCSTCSTRSSRRASSRSRATGRRARRS